tara:strand:+ start:870 stop:1265 length:396 start_codon:yes stop_codon:yes gene_type:complete
MASPLDHAWYVLKSRTERDQSSIHGEYGAPGKFRQPQTMKDIEPPEPGPARSTQNNAMKREMARQRKDAERGEKRDPLEMGELEDEESRPLVNPLSTTIDASEFDPQSAEEKAATRRYIEEMMRGGFPPKM